MKTPLEFARAGFLRGEGQLCRPKPPVHDALTLGKEAMAADVDAVSFVLDGAGNASHEVLFCSTMGSTSLRVSSS